MWTLIRLGSIIHLHACLHMLTLVLLYTHHTHIHCTHTVLVHILSEAANQFQMPSYFLSGKQLKK